MREIKFRGRISQCLRNAGQWAYWGINGTDMLDAIDSCTIGQYTGLKDKNGKEIYEGDIINNVEAVQEPWVQVVEYSKDASFVRRDISEGDDSVWEFYGWDEVGKDFEIIGNLYENPELIEV